MRYVGWLCVLTLCVGTVRGEEWGQFRGPDGQGHSSATNLPSTWSESENIVWKTAIPGRGWSSPVYANGIVWLTTAIEKPISEENLAKIRDKKLAANPMAQQMSLVESVSLHVISLDLATGKILSDNEIGKVQDPPAIHTLNSYASPTPILDGHLLLCHFGELGTMCFDTGSKQVLWSKVLPATYAVGAGSSPILYRDLMIVPCDGTDKQYVVALHKQTGEEVWQTKRPRMTGLMGDFHKAYSSPLLVTASGKEQVVIPGAQWVCAYDPGTGKELWRVRHGEGFSNAPRPVMAGELICISSGFMKPEFIAIKMDGEGDVTKTHVAWKISKQVPTMPSPVVVGQEMYFVNDQGVATCANIADGKPLWTKRLAGNFSSSPLAADGKIYFSDQDGKTTVIQPGPAYSEIAVNKLDGRLMASPAVFEQSLIMRTHTHLYRIASQKTTAAR